MALLLTKEKIAKTLAKTEEALNLIGYIPMISALSGAARMIGGKVQALLGFFLAIFSLFAAFNSPNKIRHILNFRTSIEHLLHGICNIVRGSIEVVPVLSLVTCLPYDRLFKKRFKYTFEDSDIIEVQAEKI